jgi:site-specific recombinase XerD
MNEKYLNKLLQDMQLKNFTASTIETYWLATRNFLKYINKDASLLTYADIRNYIFYLQKEEGKMPSTINCYLGAIRFFCEYTLGFEWNSRKVPKMKTNKKLPLILTKEEVNTYIDSFESLKYKTIVSTMYSSGMRVSEVLHLRYEDISRKKKQIYIRNAKNRMDRYALLSERNLDILTEYWYRYNRPIEWLFPSQVTGKPLTHSAIALYMNRQTELLEWNKKITPHTMRHCFAVHMLEDGISHTFIQQLLGHRSPSSTEHYLQMTSKALMGIRSPFDTEGGSNE